MMTGRELFEFWAPADSVWSPWVAPVVFAQLSCIEDADAVGEEHLAIWHESAASPENAIVVDLPGAHAVKWGLALARIGYRPVVAINASPGPAGRPSMPSSEPPVVLDMSSLVKEICASTARLRQISLACDAPPVFILDSQRILGTRALREDLFDNRWMVFPQDFPSARFLLEHGIRRVTLVQTRSTQPFDIFAKGTVEGPPSRISLAKPSRFRAMWYRALAILGLRRGAGGFGAFRSEFFGGG
jgi:hypothetical protein